MKKINLLVKNIYCSGCSDSIKSELKKKGVISAKIKLDCSDVQRMLLQCRQNTSKREILETLQKRGIELVSIK